MFCKLYILNKYQSFSVVQAATEECGSSEESVQSAAGLGEGGKVRKANTPKS